MPKKSIARRGPQLETLIYEIRGQRVMLDSDLAKIYGVETKSLNRAVKRNTDRFPKDFVFQISLHEWENLKCQIGASSLEHGGRRRRPYAFTEHGAIMAANVLNSSRAVQMFTRLSSSQFYNELWTSSILRPCQLRRPSRELALIPEIWNAASTLHRFYDSRFTIHESRSLSAPS